MCATAFYHEQELTGLRWNAGGWKPCSMRWRFGAASEEPRGGSYLVVFDSEQRFGYDSEQSWPYLSSRWHNSFVLRRYLWMKHGRDRSYLKTEEA